MRIVQVANFVSPTSSGLRTTLRHLTEGYADSGDEVVQVLPAAVDGEVETPWGRRVMLRSALLETTGYRLLLDRSGVRRALERVDPAVLEVHDRTTLRGLGRWARSRGVPSLVVSHERLDRWRGQWLPARLPLAALADRSNAALTRNFDTGVCTTAWAAEEFRRLQVPNLALVPLAVDTTAFRARTDQRADEGGGGGSDMERRPLEWCCTGRSCLGRRARPSCSPVHCGFTVAGRFLPLAPGMVAVGLRAGPRLMPAAPASAGSPQGRGRRIPSASS